MRGVEVNGVKPPAVPNRLSWMTGGIRTVSCAVLLLFCLGVRASAEQHGDPSLDRIRAALLSVVDQPMAIATEPPVKSWGGMSLIQPDVSRREFVKVRIPIGEYAMKAARAVGNARHERALRKARDDVDRALREFLKQPKR